MRLAARHRRTALAVLLSGLLALVCACSTGGPQAQQASANKGATGFPVTIQTAFGEVRITEPPQRVVALGWGDAEVALSLGVAPVGAADWPDIGGDGLGQWVRQHYQQPPAKLGTQEVDMEQVAKLNPDLILDTRASGQRERYDKLRELGVPVIGPPKGATAYLTSWQDQLDMVGKALGHQDRARKQRDDLEAKFDRAREENPRFAGSTVVVAARSASSWGAFVNGGSRVEFLERLGFTNSPRVQKLAGDSFSVPISDERLDLLDADLTVVFPVGVGTREITDDPLYQAIPSVKDGRGVLLDDRTLSQAFASGTAQGLSYALDKTVPRFAAALAG